MFYSKKYASLIIVNYYLVNKLYLVYVPIGDGLKNPALKLYRPVKKIEEYN